ncbi:hypothetical protein COOONC_22395 [Cooperia oncophora]
MVTRIFRPIASTKTPLKGRPLKGRRIDCTTEVDAKGVLCKDWAQSGLCHAHRPTMFLFCRKTCLCGHILSFN